MPRTLILGDSLGEGTTPYLRRLLQGHIDADTKVGRSSADGVSHVRSGYDRVLLDLGTNDGTAEQLRASVRRARAQAGGATIFVATVHGPDAARKNAMLRNLNGVTVVDWAAHSAGKLAGDGIHATPQGYEARAKMIAAAMRGASGGAPVVASVAPAAAQAQAPPLNDQRRQAILSLLGGMSSPQSRDVATARAMRRNGPIR